MEDFSISDNALEKASLRFLEKADKLLIKKKLIDKSLFGSLMKWSFDKKESKVLSLYENITPNLEATCNNMVLKLLSIENKISKDKKIGTSYIILLKLSYYLYQARIYYIDDILDESKQIAYILNVQISNLKSAILFNQEILSSSVDIRSRQSSIRVVDHDDEPAKELISISLPAVWHGFKGALTKKVTLAPLSTPATQQAAGQSSSTSTSISTSISSLRDGGAHPDNLLSSLKVYHEDLSRNSRSNSYSNSDDSSSFHSYVDSTSYDECKSNPVVGLKIYSQNDAEHIYLTKKINKLIKFTKKLNGYVNSVNALREKEEANLKLIKSNISELKAILKLDTGEKFYEFLNSDSICTACKLLQKKEEFSFQGFDNFFSPSSSSSSSSSSSCSCSSSSTTYDYHTSDYILNGEAEVKSSCTESDLKTYTIGDTYNKKQIKVDKIQELMSRVAYYSPLVLSQLDIQMNIANSSVEKVLVAFLGLSDLIGQLDELITTFYLKVFIKTANENISYKETLSLNYEKSKKLLENIFAIGKRIKELPNSSSHKTNSLESYMPKKNN